MQAQMRLQNTQTVTPQMIASMTVLQCGVQELSEYLEELSYENPLMELEQPEQPGPDQALTDRLRWLRGTDRQNRSYYADPDRDSPDQYLRDTRTETLTDFVKEQILTLDASPALRAAMETVAELLDDRGLFTEPLSEIVRLAGCDRETAAQALETVRSLEPAGVAAESVQQALLAQLGDRPVAQRLVREHFRHLATWSEQRIARAMGLSPEAVTAAKRQLAALNPHPANGFSPREQIQYVTPDLCIVEEAGGFRAESQDTRLPKIRISGEYLRMLDTEPDPAVQQYLRQKLRQLEQVMDNLGRRTSTVQRCGQVIAERQAAFFRGGVLQKLTLRDVAEELELHESTVSRAVKNKYLSCSRGVFPMSAFFSRDVGQNVGLSRSGVQQAMREILEQEDPAHPLSDEKIAAALGKRRILLSRRAVAKYRGELGIPTASARKHRPAVS